MSDTWAAAAAWNDRSTFRTAALKDVDCTGGTGSGAGGGGGQGGGGQGGGGAGGGNHGTVCRDCGCGAHPRSGRSDHHHGDSTAHHPAGGCSERGHDGCQSCGCPSCGCQHCGCRSCVDHDGDHAGPGGVGPDGGQTLGWKNPNRPGRHYGTTTGRLPGGRLEPCDFDTPPWNSWPGTRGDLYLPYLLMRANAGDVGARPVVGPFWESPDILLLAGVDPAVAPARPPDLGQTALAGKPNTLYAHVWNFGLSAAPNVVVEFYWCDPTLGIGPASAHLVGQTTVSLGDRGSGRSHTVVKCPVAWVPTFVNGGHECLVVRVWDETSDGLGSPPWDAALNRHVAQRNIHVIAAADQPHAARLLAGGHLILPVPIVPVTLNIGPLYGEPAVVTVARAAPHEMPWLQLRTGVRGQFPIQALPTGDLLLSPPAPIGGGLSAGPGAATTHQVAGDDQQVQLTTGDALPAPGQAHVYRVTASQQGQVFGGYTVVLMG